MATVQGDFPNTETAAQAKAALKQAGIIETRIRVWNILEGGDRETDGGSAVTTGAAVGGLVAGGTGLVAGAGIGAILEGQRDDDRHLPEPSGVCVVVDIDEDQPHIESILRSFGAANIHSGPTPR